MNNEDFSLNETNNLINAMNRQINKLKNKLEIERSEHIDIYQKIKKENDDLLYENNLLKNKLSNIINE
tara:strand:- start:1591 stop:1794 length:204 start_codon:yes stop_codon:yes gene_type:complete